MDSVHSLFKAQFAIARCLNCGSPWSAICRALPWSDSLRKFVLKSSAPARLLRRSGRIDLEVRLSSSS